MDDTQASMYQHFISQATSTVKQAIAEDTAGNMQAAIGLYVSSTVLYMKALEFVQDEDFKKRVKVEVSKYLQRAQDLRAIEKQNMTPQEIHNQNQQQKLQQIHQQQQAFRDQRQSLQDYLHAPPQPLPPDYDPHSSHPQPSYPQPGHLQSPHSQPSHPTSQLSHTQPSHNQPPTQSPSTHPSTQSPPTHTQPSTQTQQSTGLLGSLLNKVKNSGNSSKDPHKNPKAKFQKSKKPKAKKGSDDESEDESEEETSEEEEEEEEDEDEEGNEKVEQLVKEVEQEEGKTEKEEGEEEAEGGKEKKETRTEYLQEIPDEQTLKTIDRMLMEEEKRVNAELKQTSVTDDRIADKIASLRYGMGLGMDDSQEGELDDEVLKDLIMESRIAALGEDAAPKKPAKTKKKPK
eukprot:Phypoly_transcript_02790.p1 GENE.Phypoly_transcript_02790~~Phypoly_transcript_02790.p1  ORF type:complete len:402 (+),score=134.70 Phypoly_transcript_02790:1410-2615(+)